MEQDIIKSLDEQGKKIDAIFKSVESTRKYFKWTLIISVVVIVLPLIGILLLLPSLLSSIALPAGL